jgi:hypothetical protein
MGSGSGGLSLRGLLSLAELRSKLQFVERVKKRDA